MDKIIKTEVIDITPAMAAKLLETNNFNRNLSKNRVENLASMMLNGTWEFNGDTIRISEKGVLLDGQHRLHALIKSNKTLKCIVVSNLPDEVFTTIDVGASRSASDFLSIDGFKHTTSLAAAALLVFNYQNSNNPLINLQLKNKASKRELLQICRDNPDLLTAVSRVAGSNKLNTISSPSVLSFCYFIFSKANKEKAEMFFNELEAGYYSYFNSPIAILRDRLMTSKNTSITDRKITAALLFTTWNYFVKNRAIKLLKLPSDESTWFDMN